MIKLTVEITKTSTKVKTEEGAELVFYQEGKKLPAITSDQLLIYVTGREPKAIDYNHEWDKSAIKEPDQVIALTVPWDIEGMELAQVMLQAWQDNQLAVKNLFDTPKIAANHFPTLTNIQTELFEIFATFGIVNEKQKKKPMKAQHRWNKKVSEIPFYIDYSDSKGEVLWQKRNEMLLKAGAKLKMEMPLNKDGSIGFSARLTEKLRADYSDKIANGVTTEDIILKSVNEVGLFLYFAGTNGWLVLKDQNGKTIDEYTIVK